MKYEKEEIYHNLNASPQFFKIDNKELDYQYLKSIGLLLLPLIDDIKDTLLVEIIYRNIFAIEYFKQFGYDDLFNKIIIEENITIKDVEDNYLINNYFDRDVYREILENSKQNIYVVFEDWDIANREIKKFMNNQVRIGFCFSDSKKLLFNLSSILEREDFVREDWKTWCDNELILFGHEIQNLNLNDKFYDLRKNIFIQESLQKFNISSFNIISCLKIHENINIKESSLKFIKNDEFIMYYNDEYN